MPSDYNAYISKLYHTTSDEDDNAAMKLLLDGCAIITASNKKKEDLSQEISSCWDNKEQEDLL